MFIFISILSTGVLQMLTDDGCNSRICRVRSWQSLNAHYYKALFRAPDSAQLNSTQQVELSRIRRSEHSDDLTQLNWAEWASVVIQFSSGHMMSTPIPISFT